MKLNEIHFNTVSYQEKLAEITVMTYSKNTTRTVLDQRHYISFYTYCIASKYLVTLINTFYGVNKDI